MNPIIPVQKRQIPDRMQPASGANNQLNVHSDIPIKPTNRKLPIPTAGRDNHLPLEDKNSFNSLIEKAVASLNSRCKNSNELREIVLGLLGLKDESYMKNLNSNITNKLKEFIIICATTSNYEEAASHPTIGPKATELSAQIRLHQSEQMQSIADARLAELKEQQNLYKTYEQPFQRLNTECGNIEQQFDSQIMHFREHQNQLESQFNQLKSQENQARNTLKAQTSELETRRTALVKNEAILSETQTANRHELNLAVRVLQIELDQKEIQIQQINQRLQDDIKMFEQEKGQLEIKTQEKCNIIDKFISDIKLINASLSLELNKFETNYAQTQDQSRLDQTEVESRLKNLDINLRVLQGNKLTLQRLHVRLKKYEECKSDNNKRLSAVEDYIKELEGVATGDNRNLSKILTQLMGHRDEIKRIMRDNDDVEKKLLAEITKGEAFKPQLNVTINMLQTERDKLLGCQSQLKIFLQRNQMNFETTRQKLTNVRERNIQNIKEAEENLNNIIQNANKRISAIQDFQSNAQAKIDNNKTIMIDNKKKLSQFQQTRQQQEARFNQDIESLKTIIQNQRQVLADNEVVIRNNESGLRVLSNNIQQVETALTQTTTNLRVLQDNRQTVISENRQVLVNFREKLDQNSIYLDIMQKNIEDFKANCKQNDVGVEEIRQERIQVIDDIRKQTGSDIVASNLLNYENAPSRPIIQNGGKAHVGGGVFVLKGIPVLPSFFSLKGDCPILSKLELSVPVLKQRSTTQIPTEPKVNPVTVTTLSVFPSYEPQSEQNTFNRPMLDSGEVVTLDGLDSQPERVLPGIEKFNSITFERNTLPEETEIPIFPQLHLIKGHVLRSNYHTPFKVTPQRGIDAQEGQSSSHFGDANIPPNT